MIKRVELSRSSSLTAHHFLTLLNFVTLLITVAWLIFNAHLLRQEIESVKADVRPLLEANKKPSRPFADFVFKSRNIRQLEPGGGGGHGGMMTMTASPDEGGGGHSPNGMTPESPQTTKETPHGGMDGTAQPQPHSSPVKLKCTQVCSEWYPLRIVSGSRVFGILISPFFFTRF